MIVVDASVVVDVLAGVPATGELGVARAQALLVDFDDLPIHRWPAAGDALQRRAFELRDDVSGYDAAYVVLAEALECPLLTRDVRLGRTVGHHARIDVR